MKASLRLQNADLLTDYNLYECNLARPKVKAADFDGKEAHLKFREREHQPATGATLIDAVGRRSYTTSIAFGPTIGKNIALAYLPHEYCQVGRELQIQYFADVYPVRVEAMGYKALYDAENSKPWS